MWMSHGDRIVALPAGLHRRSAPRRQRRSAPSPTRSGASTASSSTPRSCTRRAGGEILAAFLFDVAGSPPTWTPASFIEEAIAAVREKVGPDDRAMLGLSGGVDSSVAAVLCQRALGDRLTCIFVDNGLLRQGEAERWCARSARTST